MALKTAEAYLPAYLAVMKCPPNSSQVPFYLAQINFILLVLKDADVSPLPGLVAPSGGGAVTGLGKIV